MLNLLPLLAWAALGLMVLFASRYLLVMLTLRRLRFAPVVAAEHIGFDEVPAAHRRLLDLAAPRLREFGFAPAYALRMPTIVVSQPPVMQYADVWLHEASGSWAVVALRDEPEYGNLYAVSFYSFYAREPHLYTTARRGHEQFAVHPAVSVFDTTEDLAQQWRAHLERMQRRGADQVLRDRDTLEAIEKRMPIEARAAACAAGLLVAQLDGTAQFSWRGAWKLLRAYQRGARVLSQQPLRTAVANGIDPADTQAADMRARADAIALGKALATRRHDPGRRYKGSLLLATGLLSMLLFGWQFDWQFALVLVAVLSAHELGHVLVMRWAGYRDLQVLFIPLFGAVASGRDERVAAWKKMLVLLAGPLPGVALGMALLHGLITHTLPAQGWLFVTTSTLLVINLFNLLPFPPLDGGRLLDLLLFTRLPRLRGWFEALGALALVIGGVWLRAPLMAVLGGVLVLALPVQFRQARLFARLPRVHNDGVDEEGQWLHELSVELTVGPTARLRFAQRFAIAQSMLKSSASSPPPVATMVIGLLLYGASLSLPLWVLAEHGFDILAAASASYTAPGSAGVRHDYERELTQAASDDARFKILFAAAADAEDDEDFVKAQGYYQDVADLAGPGTATQAQRVKALIGLSRTAEDGEAARVVLENLLKSLVADDRQTRLQRAEVLTELNLDFSAQNNDANLARAAEVVATRTALLTPADPALIEARRALAWRLWQADRADEAVTQLRARAQALTDKVCAADCVTREAWTRSQAYADLGWLLLALDQHVQAAHLAHEYPSLRDKPDQPRYMLDDSLPVLDAWTQHANGEHAAAIASLSALLEADNSQHSVFMELQWLIDVACFAEQAGDRPAMKKWTDKLHERMAAMHAKSPHLSLAWIAKAREVPYSWARVRFDQELSWLSSHEPALLNVAP